MTNKADRAVDRFWYDRDIRFDISPQELEFHSGENLIDRLDAVEDTKGNNGEKGKMFITNLRMIWQSISRPRISLSIGFNCITSIDRKTVNSKIKGISEALYILTKTNNTRFEFVFTNLRQDPARLLTSVIGVSKAYTSSKIYREMKLRAAVILSKQLRVLPQEQIYNKVNGVWNLSSDQGNLGTFFITNIRLVWYANMNELFNISLPYIQMAKIKLRESKFGMALVVETSGYSGGFVLGFKVDPFERLQEVHKELSSLFQVHRANPIYGVDHYIENRATGVNLEERPTVQTFDEDVEIINSEDQYDIFAAYFADDAQHTDREVVYNEELGLAIEKLKEGFTISSLWEVIPS